MRHGLIGVILLVALIASLGVQNRTARAAQQPSATATPASVIAPVTTATPRADGSLVHVVGFGQTLPEIAKAYGVTVTEIQRLNGLPPDSSTLYSGQKLLIVPKDAFLLPQSATATTFPTTAPAETPITGPTAPTMIAPAAGNRQDNGLILPIAGVLILLGGFLLLAAALVIGRKK
jgi:LysM repeat protein